MHKPAIGAQLNYWPAVGEVAALGQPLEPGRRLGVRDVAQPLFAQVAYASNHRKVTVVGFDHAGLPFRRVDVLLLQGDESYKPVTAYCTWPV